MSMHRGRLFWGSALVAFGGALLAQRLGVHIPGGETVLKFWPLVLVFWGAAILSRGSGFSTVAAVLAGLTLAALSWSVAGLFTEDDETRADPLHDHEHSFVQPIDSTVRRASFRCESGAGNFTLNGTTGNLVDVSARTEHGRYILHAETVEHAADVSLMLEQEKHDWMFNRAANRVSVRLNQDIPWDIQFSVGASKVDLDLTPFNVEKVSLTAGASEVWIRLGEKADESTVHVSSGVSSIKILVPLSAACEIRTDGALTRKSFRDFRKSSEGTWRTENFSTGNQKIFITFESGVSQLTVIRY
jgi:hypothetical protein